MDGDGVLGVPRLLNRDGLELARVVAVGDLVVAVLRQLQLRAAEVHGLASLPRTKVEGCLELGQAVPERVHALVLGVAGAQHVVDVQAEAAVQAVGAVADEHARVQRVRNESAGQKPVGRLLKPESWSVRQAVHRLLEAHAGRSLQA